MMRPMIMRRLPVLVASVLLLSACSHKPLKAPCDLNEGKPTAVIGFVLSSLLPESLVALVADGGPCGPLRRLGQD